jgi:hypothetical protein
LVRKVAFALEAKIGRETVFFDEWFEHVIAGEDAMAWLQSIYKDRSDLVVVCTSREYSDKSWTKFEYRVIQALAWDAAPGSTEAMRKLPLQFGEGQPSFIVPPTIIPDMRRRSPEETADFIIARLNHCAPGPDSPPPDKVGAPQSLPSSSDSARLAFCCLLAVVGGRVGCSRCQSPAGGVVVCRWDSDWGHYLKATES